MFWIKTLKKMDKNLIKMFERIGTDVGTLQGKQEIYENKLNNLEKRINNIADYIQGPYTKQINENFTQINLQIQTILDKKFNKKLKKEMMPKDTIKASKPKRIK